MATRTALQDALESRLRAHPNDLADVVRSLTATYADVRRARATEPRAAVAQLDALLTKVRCLLQLPADAVPVDDGAAWRGQLRRILTDCEAKRAALLPARVAEGAATSEGVGTGAEGTSAGATGVDDATTPAPTRYDHARRRACTRPPNAAARPRPLVLMGDPGKLG